MRAHVGVVVLAPTDEKQCNERKSRAFQQINFVRLSVWMALCQVVELLNHPGCLLLKLNVYNFMLQLDCFSTAFFKK